MDPGDKADHVLERILYKEKILIIRLCILGRVVLDLQIREEYVLTLEEAEIGVTDLDPVITVAEYAEDIARLTVGRESRLD